MTLTLRKTGTGPPRKRAIVGLNVLGLITLPISSLTGRPLLGGFSRSGAKTHSERASELVNFDLQTSSPFLFLHMEIHSFKY